MWLGNREEYTRNGGSTVIPKQHVVITPGGAGIQNLQQETGKGLYLLMTISALVLLVACANVANLLLARGATRKAETSIRMALGAARSRLIRQMLTESVLLGCLGGLAGLAVAYAGTRTILSLAFPDAPNLPIDASPSLPVLGFAFLLSLVTGIVFGIVPAWITSHSDPAEALRGVNRSTRDRASLPQKSLIVFQAALSLVLLVSAGLADQEPAQPGASEFRHPDGQPLRAAPGSGRRGIHAGEAAGSLSGAGAAVRRAARSAECGAGAVQHAGGQQLGRGHPGRRAARAGTERAQWIVVGPGESEVF